MEIQVNNNSAPELRPTWEEFEHPIKYLSRPEIEQLGDKYGILKVIPPEGWRPNFSLDWDSFKFHTRIQKLHELNLRNRSRACFVEGFNCYLESCGLTPVPTIDNLCLGVSNDYSRSEDDLKERLNGWIKLKSGESVHIHDIFLSREFRSWFRRVGEGDKSFLQKLVTYSRFLLGVLRLEKVERVDAFKDEGDLVIPPEKSHSALHELLKSPAALLKQPDNKLKLQKMRKRLMTSMRKRGGKMVKRRKLDNMLTPPMDDNDENKSGIFEGDGINEAVNFPVTPDILAPEELEEACTICYKKGSIDSTIICEGCERVFHMRCLPIPLKRIPRYDWFCGGCLAGSTNGYSEYGFEEEFEKMFSLKEFQEYCRNWEIELIRMIKSGKILGKDIKLSGEEIVTNKLSEETIEKLFWSFTNGEIYLPEGIENMKIRYGADIHNEKAGEVSGFPTIDNPRYKEEDESYINSEWNLNKLPFARGSLLDYICKSLSEEDDEKNDKEVKNQISGMTVPWVYIGGPLSTFCWHKEDHYTLSANYSHLGAPKKWYGISAKDSFKFEEIVNKVAPEYEAKQKDLMHQLVSMISPEEIKSELKIYETIQHPGEFIITFPKVYHSGFNYGFNVNEAVNFTLPLWVPFSIPAVKEYEEVGKECVFDTFKLLKRVYFDLNSEEGRKRWIKDTGISEYKVNELIKWVNEAYNEEVMIFEKTLENEAVSKAIKEMKHVNVKEYQRMKYKGKSESENESGDDDDDDDNDDGDKLCMDCKTRVHFKWVVIDVYEDWMRMYKDEKKPLRGLGIGYKDVESEWQSIIERAKQESLEEEGVKLRRSSRKRKSHIEEVDEEEIHYEKDEDRLELREECSKEMYGAMLALRSENGEFGKCVFCPRCLGEEMSRLSKREVARVCKAGVVVFE